MGLVSTKISLLFTAVFWLMSGLSGPSADPAREVVHETLAGPTSFDDEMYGTFKWSQFVQWEEVNRAIDYKKPDVNLLNAAIFYYTNQYRIRKGLPALEFHPSLRDAAVFHSHKMANENFYGHMNKKEREYRSCGDRAQHFGYPTPNVGENIAFQYFMNYKDGSKFWYKNVNGRLIYYYGTSQQLKKPIRPLSYLEYANILVNQWIDSPPHEENMRNPYYKYMGCGIAPDTKSFTINKIPQSLATQNFGA